MSNSYHHVEEMVLLSLKFASMGQIDFISNSRFSLGGKTTALEWVYHKEGLASGDMQQRSTRFPRLE